MSKSALNKGRDSPYILLHSPFDVKYLEKDFTFNDYTLDWRFPCTQIHISSYNGEPVIISSSIF
jgi:hypothetical protein